MGCGLIRDLHSAFFFAAVVFWGMTSATAQDSPTAGETRADIKGISGKLAKDLVEQGQAARRPDHELAGIESKEGGDLRLATTTAQTRRELQIELVRLKRELKDSPDNLDLLRALGGIHLRLDDLDALVWLLDQLKEETTMNGPVEHAAVRKTYLEMLRLPDVYKIFVAVEVGRVVGMISLSMYKTLLHVGGTALINEMVVTKSSRGRGIGRKLVERAMTEARERGMDEIEVGTEQNNQPARRFYASVGFQDEYVLFGKEF